MSKITREPMTIFGSSAGANELEEFGSLANGAPAYVTPGASAISQIQTLSAWLEGWYGAIVGSDLPVIQDLNSVCYLFAYQIAYGFQSGIPEYNSATPYYTNSLCMDGATGIVYISLINTNTGNTPSSSPSDWTPYSYPFKAPTVTILTAGSGTYTTPTGAVYLRLRMIAAGGGGAGGSATSPVAGSIGTGTWFGPSSGATLGLAMTPGSGAGSSTPGGGGSSSTPLSPAVQIISGYGADGLTVPLNVAVSGGRICGGIGGVSSFGGPAFISYGNGGSGGVSATSNLAGCGGGAGGYCEAFLMGPLSATYSYLVGTGGAGGVATTGGNGLAGGNGIIIIEEYYC